MEGYFWWQHSLSFFAAGSIAYMQFSRAFCTCFSCLLFKCILRQVCGGFGRFFTCESSYQRSVQLSRNHLSRCVSTGVFHLQLQIWSCRLGLHKSPL